MVAVKSEPLLPKVVIFQSLSLLQQILLLILFFLFFHSGNKIFIYFFLSQIHYWKCILMITICVVISISDEYKYESIPYCLSKYLYIWTETLSP